MKLRTWLPLVAFAIFVAVTGWALFRPGDETVRSAMVGQPLPDFTLPPAIDGKPGLTTADFRDGKPRLLNIWASWCVPCAAEAPQLDALKQAGAVIAGIAIRDKPEDVAAFLARYGDPYAAIGRDDVSAVQLAIGSSGVPETFVIDGRGIIRYQHIGDIRPDDVAILLEQLREAGQ